MWPINHSQFNKKEIFFWDKNSFSILNITTDIPLEFQTDDIPKERHNWNMSPWLQICKSNIFIVSIFWVYWDY